MIDYNHPNSLKIIESSITILKHSDTALRLMSTLETTAYTVTIFKTPYPQPFVPDNTHIYLGIAATQDYADIEQVIDLAAGMIELKKIRAGEIRPKTNSPEEQNLQRQHLYNLDVMLHTFPIIEELEFAGYKAVDAVERTGYKKLYKAWLNESSYEDFINIYWDML